MSYNNIINQLLILQLLTIIHSLIKKEYYFSIVLGISSYISINYMFDPLPYYYKFYYDKYWCIVVMICSLLLSNFQLITNIIFLYVIFFYLISFYESGKQKEVRIVIIFHIILALYNNIVLYAQN